MNDFQEIDDYQEIIANKICENCDPSDYKVKKVIYREVNELRDKINDNEGGLLILIFKPKKRTKRKK